MSKTYTQRSTRNSIVSSLCRLACLSATGLVVGACANVESDVNVDQADQPLLGGTPAKAPWVLNLGRCTAIAVNPTAVVTARHCIPTVVQTNWQSQDCLLRDAEGQCVARSARVQRNPSVDLALLTLPKRLPSTIVRSIPPILLSRREGAARAFGWGAGSVQDVEIGAGERLLSARFTVSQVGADSLVATAVEGGPAVCGGDSGGPLAFGAGGALVVGGLLTTSEGAGLCTPPGGTQRWLRLGSYVTWLEEALGAGCPRGTVGGERVARCDEARPGIPLGKGDTLLDAIIEAAPLAASGAEALEVDVGTARGNAELRIDPTKLNPTPGEAGEAAFESARGWSNGVDSRQLGGLTSSLTQRVGYIEAWNSSFTKTCTAELIYPRVLRTAAHCIMVSGPNGGEVFTASHMRFYWERSGGNWTAQVTPIARTWLSKYRSKGCNTATTVNGTDGATTNDDCINYDVAFLMLPDGYWEDVNRARPAYFGYLKWKDSFVGNNATFAGYPSCTETGAPSGCSNQRLYSESGASCTIYSKLGFASFLTNCDTSPGQSGGPIWNSSNQIYGNCSREYCRGNCSGNSHIAAPNLFAASDSWLVGYMNDLRAAYPH